MGMPEFVSFLNTLDIDQLKQCHALIKDVIANKSPNLSNIHSASQNSTAGARDNINDYVECYGNFVQKCDRKNLLEEVRSLKLGIASSPGKVANTFLSFYDEPYVWESSHGPVINDPVDFNSYPEIKSLMEKVNKKFDCELNTALVSHYKSGEAGIRLHDDNEPSLDPDSPICVVSLGATRKIEFVDKSNSDFRHTIKSINPEDSSVYIMRPGCQEHFLHRVRKDRRIKHERFIISFRKFIPEKERQTNLYQKSFSVSPVTNLLKKFDCATPIPPAADLNRVANGATPRIPQPRASTATRDANVKSVHVDSASVGFSPFSRDDSFPSGVSNNNTSNNKYCVIFGTSITTNVDGAKLSRRSRKVINCSASGAKIGDISDEIKDFCVDNPGIISNVDKVIICLGTNDIKFFNGVKFNVSKKFRSPLTRLVNLIKFLLPEAQIVFKCVLPMKVYYNYTAKTVHDFNYLLLEICRKNGCIFFDCFAEFVDVYGYSVEEYLYRDKWHLNNEGLKVLCRALKFVIYNDIFNPIMRIHFSEYTYLDW